MIPGNEAGDIQYEEKDRDEVNHLITRIEMTTYPTMMKPVIMTLSWCGVEERLHAGRLSTGQYGEAVQPKHIQHVDAWDKVAGR